MSLARSKDHGQQTTGELMNEHTDTRLTDYALDELDAADRANVEALLRDDPQAAAEVEELRGLATSLRAANVGWVDGHRGEVVVGEAHAETTPPSSSSFASLRDSIAAHLDAKPAVAPVKTPIVRHKSWLGRNGALTATMALAAAALFALTIPATWRFVQSAKMASYGFGDTASQTLQGANSGALGGTEAVPLDGSLRYGGSHSSADPLGVAVPSEDSQAAPDRHTSELNYGAVNGSNATTPPVFNLRNDLANRFFKSNDDLVVAGTPLITLSQPGPGNTSTLTATLSAPDPVTTNAGTLNITGSNSYVGATMITAGKLAQSPPAGATHHVAGDGTTRGLTKVAAGTLTFSGEAAVVVNNPEPQTLGRALHDEFSDKPTTLEFAENAFVTDRAAYERRLARLGPEHPELKELEGRFKLSKERVEALRQQEQLAQIRKQEEESDTESYDSIVENPFLRPADSPLSTFSIDVDTASYSNTRRMLNMGRLPPAGAVRLEEFVNYFPYEYPQPTGDAPFSITTEAARCPWNAGHVLVRVGLKGKEMHRKERPASNLVFLVDVSGSMGEPNKLPLVRESLKLLVRELNERDRVAMVVYAGNSGLVLAPTGGDRKARILQAIDNLEAGGSTNGAAGIELAYQLATDNFIKGGVNRVVLTTDGDFNVGVTSQDELVRLIEAKAKSGVFFSALGYGMGNYKDSTLEKLADKGNGNYAYIDTLNEARKVLVEQMSGTLVTIAKDVKIQIEFNPARVAGYRLLGYENRILAAQDFNDDKKDAGEIGAGHSVTALYELIPAGKRGEKEAAKLPEVDPLKYQPMPEVKPLDAVAAKELLTLKLRYKQPDGEKSELLEQPLADEVSDYAQASADFKFASAVAGFGMLLRDSKYKGSATFDAVVELTMEGVGRDEFGYRKEFVELVLKAKESSKIR